MTTDGSAVRYGVFARPDPATAHAVAHLHRTLGVRFGLRAAAIFPPSLVLVRNIATDASAEDVRTRIESALTGQPRTVLADLGAVVKADGSVVCPVADPPDRPGALDHVVDLSERMQKAVDPVRLSASGDYLQDQPGATDFVPEILVAGQDLVDQPHLHDAVREFLAGSTVVIPPLMPVDYIGLYEFRLADWTRPWWPGLTWRLLWSWPLAREV